jgi:hypothetical protein
MSTRGAVGTTDILRIFTAFSPPKLHFVLDHKAKPRLKRLKPDWALAPMLEITVKGESLRARVAPPRDNRDSAEGFEQNREHMNS